MTASECGGVTATGAPCRRAATNPSGWCGVCVGVPVPGHAAGRLGLPSAPADPLADDPRPSWVDHLDAVSLQRLAANHDTSIETLRQLVAATRPLDAGVAEILAQRDDTPPDVLLAVHQHLWDDDEGIDIGAGVDLASHPNAPPALLEALTNPEALDFDGDAEIARAAAVHPGCPPGVLARLAEDRWVAEAVAANPACPPGVLAGIATDGTGEAAAEAAANLACPPEVLDALADTDLDDGIVTSVAANPHTPPGALARLVADPGCPPEALAAAARNPNCPALSRVTAGLLAD